MSFKVLMTYKRILIRHIYTSVISWCKIAMRKSSNNKHFVKSNLVRYTLQHKNSILKQLIRNDVRQYTREKNYNDSTCLNRHVKFTEHVTLRCNNTCWQGARQLLCTEALIFWESSATTKIAKTLQKCFLRRATRVTFYKILQLMPPKQRHN